MCVLYVHGGEVPGAWWHHHHAHIGLHMPSTCDRVGWGLAGWGLGSASCVGAGSKDHGRWAGGTCQSCAVPSLVWAPSALPAREGRRCVQVCAGAENSRRPFQQAVKLTGIQVWCMPAVRHCVLCMEAWRTSLPRCLPSGRSQADLWIYLPGVSIADRVARERLFRTPQSWHGMHACMHEDKALGRHSTCLTASASSCS